jgi:CheY-like chemotaxis protein
VPKPKLLLADDSITIQKVVNLTFADQGMDVIAFSDGDSAMAQFDEVGPDIVLADVHMPGINGYRMCEMIRGNEATKNTPVVLLVGSFEPFDREEAERVGANAHLTKPFTSIAELVSTVEGLLAAASEESAMQVPRPDTSDIDNLYERSFAETMELPDNGGVEYEIDGYDDEMIQTSYAEPDLSAEVEEALYSTDDTAVPTVEVEDNEAESLIAESMPAAAVSSEEAVVETTAEAAEEAPEIAVVAPEVVEEIKAEEEEETGRVYDPFASVAAEPPPVQAADQTPKSEVKFSFEESDLLELPNTGAPRPVEYTVANANTANGREVVSLSPDLIDLIVQKVVDRLDERDQADEARSMSGS